MGWIKNDGNRVFIGWRIYYPSEGVFFKQGYNFEVSREGDLKDFASLPSEIIVYSVWQTLNVPVKVYLGSKTESSQYVHLEYVVKNDKSYKLDIVEERGLSQITDTGAIKEIVQKVIDANPNQVTAYKNGKVYINKEQYFDGVPELAWNFYIGGYQPLQKWLKDRKGRLLSDEDIVHYQKIVVALTETDRLMKEIDEVFEF